MITITPETLVGELAAAQPASIRIFQQYGIDFCCGGKKPLRDVCADHAVPFEDLKTAIAAAELPTDDRDWSSATLTELADHIVSRYHDTLRSELPRLGGMARKVETVHGAKLPEVFPALREALDALAEELHGHMGKEEMILFPAIRELEAARAEARVPRTRFPLGALRMPMSVMEQEHESAGELLETMRRLTSGYEVPEWACNTFRGLYSGLADLERDMHVHIHLENNILFPRTSELEREF